MAGCCARDSGAGRLFKPAALAAIFAIWGLLPAWPCRAETSATATATPPEAAAEAAPGDAAPAGASEGAEAAKGKAPVVDPALPSYAPAKGITGRLKSVGSDTMNNLLALWSEDFRKIYPSVRIEIEGKGSGTAPPALIQGTADFGPMSRDMNPDEIAQFTSAFGYPPTQLPVAIDMLAVFVHKDNPLESLTLEQLDALFSVGRKKGYGKEIRTWGDLGLTGAWANKPISLYGRNPASGTYVYFKEHVLEKGDFKPTVKQLGGSSAVIQGVATDTYGIGYSGIGYKTADVKVIPLARNKKSPAVPAEPQYGYDGTYPLSRFLLLSINYKPKSVIDPVDGRIHPIRLQSPGASRRDQGRLFAGTRQDRRAGDEIGRPAGFAVTASRGRPAALGGACGRADGWMSGPEGVRFSGDGPPPSPVFVARLYESAILHGTHAPQANALDRARCRPVGPLADRGRWHRHDRGRFAGLRFPGVGRVAALLAGHRPPEQTWRRSIGRPTARSTSRSTKISCSATPCWPMVRWWRFGPTMASGRASKSFCATPRRRPPLSIRKACGPRSALPTAPCDWPTSISPPRLSSRRNCPSR